MLTKTSTTAAIEIAPNGAVVAVTHINIMDGDEVVSQSTMRETINPGDDYSARPDVVRAVCDVMHTPSVISAYRASTDS